MNYKYLLVLLLFFPASIFAQFASISGKVTSANSKVPFANIQLLGDDFFKGTAADSLGNFELLEIPAGQYKLVSSSINYKRKSQTIEINSGEKLLINIDLEEDLLNLEQVVVSGTRNKVPIYKSPAIVSEISGKTFESTQSLTISEGLNYSPGLRIESNCQNCGFTQLRMNGLEGAYSQILINSRPIFSALAGVYGLDMIPVNMVERIEVVKGGGSVLFGGNAIAGTLNIITKDPVENSFQIGINQAFTGFESSDRTISLNASLVNKTLDKGLSFYAYRRNRNPWDANDDGFSEQTKLLNNTFGFNAFWETSSLSKIKLSAYSINEYRRGGNKFELEPHQTDITEELKHNIFGADLSFDISSRNKRHHVETYISAQFTDKNSYYGRGGRVLSLTDTLNAADVLAINAYGVSDDVSDDVSAVAGLRYSYALSQEVEFSLGSSYQYNAVQDKMPGYNRLIAQNLGVLGSYLQVEWNPVERLSIIAGGRLDFIQVDGNYLLDGTDNENKKNLKALVPRLAIMYDLTNSLKARLSYAQGYRAPQAFDEDLHVETVGGAARFVQLDANLKTERSNNISASLNFTRTIKRTQTNIVLEGFFTQLRRPFVLSNPVRSPSGITIITKRNGDNAYVQGVNFESSFAFSRKWLLQLGFTGQTAFYSQAETIWKASDESDSRADVSTKNLLRTPNLYGFFNLIYNPLRVMDISVSGTYTGAMYVPHMIEPETEYTIIKRTPQFLDVNLKLAYTLELEKDFYIEFFGGLQNIFNSYQKDFDKGAERDQSYIYGPSRTRSVFFGMNFGLN